jgi:hypothetical protein
MLEALLSSKKAIRLKVLPKNRCGANIHTLIERRVSLFDVRGPSSRLATKMNLRAG